MSAHDNGQREALFTRASLLWSIFFFLLALIPILAPKSSWFTFLALSVAIVASAVRKGRAWRDLVKPSAPVVALMVLAGYAMLTALWAADPASALSKGLVLASVTAVLCMAVRAVPCIESSRLRGAGQAFALAVAVGAAYLAIEILTTGSIKTTLASVWQQLGGGNGNDVPDAVKVGDFRNNAAMLVLMLWSGALLLFGTMDERKRGLSVGVLVLLVGLAVSPSGRLSTQLAYVVSVCAFGLALLWPRAMTRALAVLWALGFVAMLILPVAAYDAGLHKAEWIPRTARIRLIIWQYTAEQIPQAPILGIGADSTPVVAAQTKHEQPAGFISARTQGPHAHDIFLQSWYELGLVGAAIVAIAGVLVLLSIAQLPMAAQPYAIAAFTATATNLAFTWNMWQTWLIFTLAQSAVILLIGAYAVRQNGIGDRRGPIPPA